MLECSCISELKPTSNRDMQIDFHQNVKLVQKNKSVYEYKVMTL